MWRLLLLSTAWPLLCGFGLFPSGGPAPINGMCDAISTGCSEAWGIAEAAVDSYNGPLFQLTRGQFGPTLDIGQDASHHADMTTWSAFCGGTNTPTTLPNGTVIVTNSNCSYSKVYAEVHGSANDLWPSTFGAPFGPNCTAGGGPPSISCACPFVYEQATGLPLLHKTTEMCEYTLSADGPVTGVNSGSNSVSILYNGLPGGTVNCCGQAGITHAYNAPDTTGTDFSLYVSFNSPSSWGFGLDEESGGDGAVYTTSQPTGSVFVTASYNQGSNTVAGTINGSQKFSNSPPMVTHNPG